MRPRSYARKPTDAHTSSRTHPHAHTYIHPCTHVYAHAKEFFWQQICSTALSNRVPSSVRHHSLLLSNHCTIHIHIGATIDCSICTNYHHLSLIYQLSSNYPPRICQQSPNHYNHRPLSRTIYIHIISSLSNFQSNQLTIISICQYVIKPYQFSIYLPHFPSAFSYTTDFCSINLHYNHFHYGNRIHNQSSAIPIMYNYSFINFRNEIRLKPFCIIIHLNCINIHSFDFHYGNHLLIIGFYYGIRLWDFISHQYICVCVYIWT